MCSCWGDKFMRKLQDGEPEAKKKVGKITTKRKANWGEPYIMFKGNTNKLILRCTKRMD